MPGDPGRGLAVPSRKEVVMSRDPISLLIYLVIIIVVIVVLFKLLAVL